MSVGIWNFISGYVIIEIKGASPERLLNRTIDADIDVYNVRRNGADSVFATVGVGAFYSLHKLARNNGCKIRIVKKGGMLFALSGLRFRKVLLYGWVLILALLLAASRCIWVIDIEGCDVIEEGEVSAMLEGLGATVGAKRRDVATYDLGNALMRSDGRIAFASAVLEGVILRVEIKEADDATEIVSDEGRPASIYASRDGIIKEITALNGKPCYKVGDAVYAGDELISGVVRNDETGSIFVTARGSVIADVIYRASAVAEPFVMSEERTGRTIRKSVPSLFGAMLDMNEVDFLSFESADASHYALKNCFLPLRVYDRTLYELEWRKRAATRDEMLQNATALAEAALLADMSKEARILSKDTKVETLSDGTVCVTITVTAEENIGESRSIDG